MSSIKLEDSEKYFESRFGGRDEGDGVHFVPGLIVDPPLRLSNRLCLLDLGTFDDGIRGELRWIGCVDISWLLSVICS